VLVGLLTTAELVVERIRAAGESAERERMAHDAAIRDCVRVASAAHGAASDPVELAQSLRRMGSRHHARGRLGEAERFYRRALAIEGPDLFAVHAAVAEGLSSVVRLYHARGQFADAERLQAWLRQPAGDDRPTAVLAGRAATASCRGKAC
jgi:hypothetical protein